MATWKCDRPRSGSSVPDCIPVQLERRPGLHAFVQLVRETSRVSCRLERGWCQQAGHLVLPVPVARRATEDRDDHVGTEAAYDPYDVAQQRIARPMRERLFRVLGEPEIVGAGEVLSRTIQAPGGQQLSRPHDPEPLAQLRTDEVLAALSAGQRQVGRPGAQTPCQRGQKRRVFVVRVGADDKDPLDTVQLPDQESGGDHAGTVRYSLSARGTDGQEDSGAGNSQRQPQCRRISGPCCHDTRPPLRPFAASATDRGANYWSLARLRNQRIPRKRAMAAASPVASTGRRSRRREMPQPDAVNTMAPGMIPIAVVQQNRQRLTGVRPAPQFKAVNAMSGMKRASSRPHQPALSTQRSTLSRAGPVTRRSATGLPNLRASSKLMWAPSMAPVQLTAVPTSGPNNAPLIIAGASAGMGRTATPAMIRGATT